MNGKVSLRFLCAVAAVQALQAGGKRVPGPQREGAKGQERLDSELHVNADGATH